MTSTQPINLMGGYLFLTSVQLWLIHFLYFQFTLQIVALSLLQGVKLIKQKRMSFRHISC